MRKACLSLFLVAVSCATLPADNFTGVGFGPYIGAWKGTAPSASVPPFNSYSQANVRSMLSTVETRFKRVATYSAGYASYYSASTPWNQVDSNWRVGSAAASINKAAGKKELDVAQGIFQQSSDALFTAEINGAFKIAANANSTFPGTVTKLIFTNEYVTNAATTRQVTNLIAANQKRARTAKLQVGVRSNTFGQLTDPSSPYLSEMRALVKECDFIMCNIYPSKQESAAEAVQEVAATFKSIRAAALKVKPDLVVMIGETGWPSQGISFNQTVNNIANARAYFNAIRNWATNQRVVVYYFEAIDEAWKSNQNSADKSSFQGPNGAEGHYGLWTASQSGTGYSLTKKFSF